jgi:hypothetical protein
VAWRQTSWTFGKLRVITPVSMTLKKPHALPLTFSYTDGFSPALFRYIFERSADSVRSLRDERSLIVTGSATDLKELQWALLTRIAAEWKLEPA